MTQREHKRRALRIAAAILDRGGDWNEALYEHDAYSDDWTAKGDDDHRAERAWQEIIDELRRRGGE